MLYFVGAWRYYVIDAIDDYMLLCDKYTYMGVL